MKQIRYTHQLRRFGTTLAALVVGAGLIATASADSNPLYWHYTPLDSLTHGIGLSRPDGEQVAPWQARLNVGYGLDSLGVSLQHHQTLITDEPAWYLASGATVRHYFSEESDDICLISNCNRPDGEWEGTIFSRWSWGYAASDARIDLGYGAQFIVRQDSQTDSLMWSLSPTVDVTLGWSL